MTTLDPRKMAPTWSEENSRAAIAEGWEIFDCEGSSEGRWQIEEFDEPEEWAELNGGIVPPTLPGCEIGAWTIVANGTQPHHAAAREFLKAHSPEEFARVMQQKRD